LFDKLLTLIEDTIEAHSRISQFAPQLFCLSAAKNPRSLLETSKGSKARDLCCIALSQITKKKSFCVLFDKSVQYARIELSAPLRADCKHKDILFNSCIKIGEKKRTENFSLPLLAFLKKVQLSAGPKNLWCLAHKLPCELYELTRD